MRRDLFWSLVFLALARPLGACGSSARPPEQIAKTCEPLLEVEAAFQVDVIEACQDFDDPEHPENCPAFAPIDAKYQPLRADAARKCTR